MLAVHGARLDVAVGDVVHRYFGGRFDEAPMVLRVTGVRDGVVYCGHWKFDARTGGEIDEELEWTGVKTGSIAVAAVRGGAVDAAALEWRQAVCPKGGRADGPDESMRVA